MRRIIKKLTGYNILWFAVLAALFLSVLAFTGGFFWGRQTAVAPSGQNESASDKTNEVFYAPVATILPNDDASTQDKSNNIKVSATPAATKAPIIKTPTPTPSPPRTTATPIITPLITAKPTPSIESIAQMEARVLELINKQRAAKGLPALKNNDFLATLARGHSQEMASGETPFGHAGFDARVTQIREKIGGTAFAENVSYNSGYADPVKTAVAGWLASAGHLKNILGDYNYSGVGISIISKKYYFTQIFLNK